MDEQEIDALIEALAHSAAIREVLRPLVMRAEERRRIRLAVQKSRARKHDGTPADDKSAA